MRGFIGTETGHVLLGIVEDIALRASEDISASGIYFESITEVVKVSG